MNMPAMLDNRVVAPSTTLLGTFLPVPGYGILPLNTYVIAAREPVLVDTGVASMRDAFLSRLEQAIDPRDLRWIWLTHADADHLGNLAAVLERAPRARVVTTFVGMAKMGLMGLPTDRVYLLNPGQALDVGDRVLAAVKPPVFDAPETTGFVDQRSGALFSSDCFGALLEDPALDARDITPSALREGATTWATLDAPWLETVDPTLMGRRLSAVAALAPKVILSSHLPPAAGMTDTLLDVLRGACGKPGFTGPDQAALERLMAA